MEWGATAFTRCLPFARNRVVPYRAKSGGSPSGEIPGSLSPKSVATLRATGDNIDSWLIEYNTKRPHQGRGMDGRTPYQAFQDGLDWEDNREEKTNEETAGEAA